ncbi:hypothetical protein E8E13_008996 [Curvularia kusanoi]|uniref:DUF6594 domain-containing protein n=1 Tax=Curvularia kusanoi TaxID=90978 RepID=A0A9P4TEK6_CURKU|nr:hypothetical protein E8E13_008996 [Curvularia kusanoi]
MPSQLEHGLRRDGYPALAAWMSYDPDDETLIFRRFKRLAARNTLNQQAKLIALEKDLDDLDDAAWTSGNEELKQSSRRWETLVNNDASQERVRKLDMLQVLLKEYCKSAAW